MQPANPERLQELAQRARQAHAQQDYHRAISLCDAFLSKAGPVPAIMNLKLISLMAQGRYPEAEPFARAALKAAPNEAGLQANTSVVLSHRAKPREASRRALEAIRLKPRDPSVLYTTAGVFRTVGDIQRALNCVDRLLKIDPQFSDAWHLKGTLETDLGDTPMAIESLTRTVELEPANTTALSALVKLTKADLDATDRVVQLQEMGAGKRPAWSRARALFALAGMHHRSADYDAAFELYRRANAMTARQRPFFQDRYEQGLESVIAGSQSSTDSLPLTGNQGQNLVFIVGMPRSGTSLVEQLISGHSGVQGCGELIVMELIEQDLEREGIAPAVIGGARSPNATQLESARERYLAALPAHRDPTTLLLDKAPFNFERISMIHQLFPAARFVYCRRHPLDTILSCYFHDFLAGMNFSFDLGAITRVYLAQHRIMQHWNQLLVERIYTLDYELLVTEASSTMSAVAEFLGLSFEPAMVRPELNDRPVNTASALQVREPVHRDNIDGWRHYQQHLGDSIAQLHGSGLTGVDGNYPL